ncbi:MAG: amino acid permease [Robiginitomaculum sp.]|nr:MAG: amino acid permease [Robiginitomaculum sp.]
MKLPKSNKGQSMKHGSLKQVLGRADTFFLGFGAMIGWSWVILAGLWIAKAGVLGAGLAFLVGSIAITVIGFTYAELASAMPVAGGEHKYTERAFGPLHSFICTWALIFGYISVVAFEAIALPVAVTYLFPAFKMMPLWSIAGYQVYGSEVALGALSGILITGLNILGVRLAARIQIGIVFFILAAGALLVGGGLVNLDALDTSAPMWKGFSGVFAVIIMVPFMFVGFDVIPQSAEEVNMPPREIGQALVGSILLAVAFYLLIVLTVGYAPFDKANSTLYAADAAGAYWHSTKAAAFLVIAGIGGIVTSWNAFLIGGSRAVFALARSGQLPKILGEVHPRFGTPWPAIILIGIFSVLAPMLGRNALVWIVNAGGFGIVIAYLYVAASFIRLRRTDPDMDRPYKAPGGMATGIAAFILGLAIFVLYLPGSPAALKWPQEWGMLLIWAIVGVVFVWIGRNKTPH